MQRFKDITLSDYLAKMGVQDNKFLKNAGAIADFLDSQEEQINKLDTSHLEDANYVVQEGIKELQANQESLTPQKAQDKVLSPFLDSLDTKPTEVNVTEDVIPLDSVKPTSLDVYLDALGSKESSGNYKAVNRLNYLGKYQLGANALADIGVVKRGTRNRQLDNPNVWNYGLSKEAFLNDIELQESSVRKVTNNNIKYLGDRYKDATSDGERYGLLGSAHLLGASGSKKLKKVDANGVSGNDYYDYFSGLTY